MGTSLAKIKNCTFGVVGLGNFGSSVARELQRFGNHVIGIDISEARVANLAETLSQVMIVDARDDAALRDAVFGDCDSALLHYPDLGRYWPFPR